MHIFGEQNINNPLLSKVCRKISVVYTKMGFSTILQFDYIKKYKLSNILCLLNHVFDVYLNMMELIYTFLVTHNTFVSPN